MKRKLFIIFAMILTCFSLSACKVTLATTESYSLSGSVSFEQQGLSDVNIKSSIKNLATTQADGSFCFETNITEFEIFAEKEGYTFTPASIKVNKNTTNIAFVAHEIKDLNGTISLSQIQITPTSIVSSTESYAFSNNNKVCLKIQNLELSINSQNFNALPSIPYFAIKNQTNTIELNQNLTFNSSDNFLISFKLSANFKRYNNEHTFTEERTSTISIPSHKTTKDLKDGKLYYSLYGINSSNTKFTYNITFVFDYAENI